MMKASRCPYKNEIHHTCIIQTILASHIFESFNVYMYISAYYNKTDIPGVLSTEVSPCSLNNSSLMWLASRALGVFSTPLLPTTKDIRCPLTSRGLLLCRAALNFSGDDELISLRNCPGELSKAIKSVFMILFPPIYIQQIMIKIYSSIQLVFQFVRNKIKSHGNKTPYPLTARFGTLHTFG